jgi:iron complex outermembrane receptor protein
MCIKCRPNNVATSIQVSVAPHPGVTLGGVEQFRPLDFTNAINTRTDGVDVSAAYRVALESAGEVRLHASCNNTRTKIVGGVTTPPQLAGFDQVLFYRIERRRIDCGQPRDSGRTGADWRRNRFGANVNFARYGDYCSFTANVADDQTYGAKWLSDAEVSFRVAPTLTLAPGAQNLFNVFPDRNTTVNSFNGIQTSRVIRRLG